MNATLPRRRYSLWPVSVLASVVACMAISSQSFWVDEAQTGIKAAAPTLYAWWQSLMFEHNSNLQLPFYMIYIWGWARIAGLSELALRAGNIPWFALGFFAIARSLRRQPGLRWGTLLLYCVHPFVWYDLDEARPYMMQLSGALLAAGALYQALDQPDDLSRAWWWQCGAGLTVLCGAGLLGTPWAVAIMAMLLTMPAFRRTALTTGRPVLMVCVPVLLLLALYFLWTIREGVAAAFISMNAASMMEVFYEQFGFLGLGPGRTDLRTHSVAATLPFLLPLLLLAAPLAAALLVAARRRFGLTPARLLQMLLLTAGPVSFIFVFGFLRHVRILARHLTPLFPFILLAEAFGLLLLWRGGRRLGRAAAAAMVAALALSSLEVRFAGRHSRDDYRDAAAAAIQVLAGGGHVWWVADPEGGLFYHLPLSDEDQPGHARCIYWAPKDFTSAPDEIFISKADISDATGSIAAFIAAHHYQPVPVSWQAFQVWKKP
jgi:hypothetical protein